MCNIVLINPLQSFGRKVKNSLPWGCLALASYLEAKGLEVRLLDENIEQDFDTLLKEEIQESPFLGLSLMTTQVKMGLRIIRLAKEINQSIKVVVGGVHPTLFPEQTLKYPLIDFVVCGEGEKTLYELLLADREGGPFNEIYGLFYKRNGMLMKNPPRALLGVDELPRLKWDILSPMVLENFKTKAQLLTGRGCHFKCTFCINSVTHNKWRGISANDILDEIEYFKKHFNPHEIYFRDENFFQNKERILELVKGLKNRRLKINWQATTRANYFNDKYINSDLMSYLVEAGCTKLRIGAESGSQRALNFLKKGITTSQIVQAAKVCAQHGIQCYFSFMVGYPLRPIRNKWKHWI